MILALLTPIPLVQGRRSKAGITLEDSDGNNISESLYIGFARVVIDRLEEDRLTDW